MREGGLLDESRQPFTVAQCCRLEAERLEMLDDNLVQHAPSGFPRLIASGRLCHPTGEGEGRAKRPFDRSDSNLKNRTPIDGSSCTLADAHQWQS